MSREIEIVCTHDGQAWYNMPWSARSRSNGDIKTECCVTKWGAVWALKRKVKMAEKKKGKTEIVRWKR